MKPIRSNEGEGCRWILSKLEQGISPERLRNSPGRPQYPGEIQRYYVGALIEVFSNPKFAELKALVPTAEVQIGINFLTSEKDWLEKGGPGPWPEELADRLLAIREEISFLQSIHANGITRSAA